MQSGQDRAIKIIRSKADLFWNVFFYLSLLRLPHAFLFGGRTEFESHDRSHRWRLAALPHHSWCLVHADDDGGGPEHEGLRRYYEADKTLQSVHPTLFASLKPMVTDRLYDALIVVLQQRAVIAEETHALALKGQKAKHTKMQYLVMNEPLYRMLGKLLPRYGRYATTLHAKAYQKAMERLSASHRARLVVPQDNGVNVLYAAQMHSVLRLVRDSYHSEEAKYQLRYHSVKSEPAAFHAILRNDSYSRLLRMHDRAQTQIRTILAKQRECDFLGFGDVNVSTSTKVSGRGKSGSLATLKMEKRPSSSAVMARGRSNSDSRVNGRGQAQPCFVPALRRVMDDEFWLSRYRWYIYYFQPRRIKYIYFVLLIQRFYRFRADGEQRVPLPETFDFYFGADANSPMNPKVQGAMGLAEYARFIYRHFVDEKAAFKIQFSDKSIVKYIEDCLAEDVEDEEEGAVDVRIFDKMWNAVFRYLHQMTYEPFVIWINTK